MRTEPQLKVKLDNLDREDFTVLVTCQDVDAAKRDQTIRGARWEAADEWLAYAIIGDEDALPAALTAEGYDVDLTEYCPLTQH